MKVYIADQRFLLTSIFIEIFIIHLFYDQQIRALPRIIISLEKYPMNLTPTSNYTGGHNILRSFDVM